MQALNLPEYEFRFRTENGKTMIFDAIRKKFLVLSPEEWVRQNFISFLQKDKGYPGSLLKQEAPLKYNTLKKRADILAYDLQGIPALMVECKAPGVKISQDVFDQIARYNMVFRVRYLIVTNGLDHYCCMMDYTQGTYQFLPGIPDFSQL
jgi:hypothetical protein